MPSPAEPGNKGVPWDAHDQARFARELLQARSAVQAAGSAATGQASDETERLMAETTQGAARDDDVRVVVGGMRVLVDQGWWAGAVERVAESLQRQGETERASARAVADAVLHAALDETP